MVKRPTHTPRDCGYDRKSSHSWRAEGFEKGNREKGTYDLEHENREERRENMGKFTTSTHFPTRVPINRSEV
jgi:hypothetical protein